MSLVDLIFLAAGKGERLNLGYPKQFAMLGGRPIMIHSLELFQRMDQINRIIVCAIPEKTLEFTSLLVKYDIKKAKVIKGGKTRQESVRKALLHVKTGKLMVHEAVRPFITRNHVQHLLSINKPAVVPVIDVSPTIIHTKVYYLQRYKLKNVQLPQVYDTMELIKAHFIGKNELYPDDSTLFYKTLGKHPFLAEGLEENIKITTPLDLKVAEAIYSETCYNNGRK